MHLPLVKGLSREIPKTIVTKNQGVKLSILAKTEGRVPGGGGKKKAKTFKVGMVVPRRTDRIKKKGGVEL